MGVIIIRFVFTEISVRMRLYVCVYSVNICLLVECFWHGYGAVLVCVLGSLFVISFVWCSFDNELDKHVAITRDAR